MAGTPTCTIDQFGIHVPDFTTVQQYFEDGYRGIYGSDVYIEPDSQDGQLLGLFSLAVDDVNSECAAVYNSFRPSWSQGVGLSSIIKINGIARKVPSNSQVDAAVVGTAGVTITNGSARDANGVTWLLPPSVVIPPAGTITETLTASEPGAIQLSSGTVLDIATPVLNWQTITTTDDAVPGAPVESDAATRQRQTISTALPSTTVLTGITGAIAALPGVQRLTVYENDTRVSFVNGQPGNSIAYVVDGGDAQVIAYTIGLKKTPGAGTWGTTSEIYVDPAGIPHTIEFSRSQQFQITWFVTLKALAGFTTVIQNNVAQALVDWVNRLGIGTTLQRVKAFMPAQLYAGSPPQWVLDLYSTAASSPTGVATGAPYGAPNDYLTYEVTSFTVCIQGGTPGTVDIVAAYDTEFLCSDVSRVTLTITS